MQDIYNRKNLYYDTQSVSLYKNSVYAEETIEMQLKVGKHASQKYIIL